MDSEVLKLPDEAFEIINRYNLAGSKIKELKQEQDIAKAELMELMGEQKKAVCGFNKVTFTEQQKVTLDNKKFEKEHPDLFNNYKKVTTFMVMRIGELKDEQD